MWLLREGGQRSQPEAYTGFWVRCISQVVDRACHWKPPRVQGVDAQLPLRWIPPRALQFGLSIVIQPATLFR